MYSQKIIISIISNKKIANELHKIIIKKNWGKKSTLFYRQYFGCRSSRYAVDKTI